MSKQTLKDILDTSHWHFIFVAYDEKIENQLIGAVEIEIIDARTENEALEMAKEKIKRNGYFLKRAWQCRICGNNEELIRIQKKLLDKLND